MNYYQDEFTAEYNRKKIVEEFELMRLENLTRKSHVHRPTIFERSMFNFANWMISTGKQLRRRYEIPTVNCNKSPTGNFAHYS